MNIKKEFPKLKFLLPSAAGTILFFLLPLCYCFIFACSRTSGRFSFVGTDNYISLFQSETFRRAFINTYMTLFLSVCILLLITMLLVYFLDTAKKTLGILLSFSLPMLLPPVLIVKALEGTVMPPRLVLLFIFLWKYLGFHVLLLKAAERNISWEWIEAAMLERASRWQVFTKVICPYLWPYVRFLLIFDGVCFFRLFRESYLLYGIYPPDQVYMITNFFFNNFQNLNYSRLSAAAITSLVPLLIFNGILLKVGGKYEMV